MSVTRNYIAQKLLAAFGVDVPRTADAAPGKYISSSTLSSQGINHYVVPHYDELAGSTHCKLIHCRVNDSYSISTADGRYALKIYRVNWRSLESIVDELECIGQLDAGGIPVATPVERRDGARVTQIPTPEGLRHAVLFKWVDGVLPSFTDETHSARIGRHLARLHTAGDRVRLGQMRRRLDVAELFERPRIRIRSHFESESRQVARFDSLVERLSRRVQVAAGTLTDWGFCHGDAAHVNLSIDGDQVYFFDFEWCGSGWRVYDVATYIWSAHHFGHVRDFRWQTLVNSYVEERRQYAAAAELIPLFVVLRHFWHASQIIGLAPHLGANLIGNRFFESFISFCEQFAPPAGSENKI